MPRCYILQYWTIVENILVGHQKIGGVQIQNAAPGKHRFATSKEA